MPPGGVSQAQVIGLWLQPLAQRSTHVVPQQIWSPVQQRSPQGVMPFGHSHVQVAWLKVWPVGQALLTQAKLQQTSSA